MKKIIKGKWFLLIVVAAICTFVGMVAYMLDCRYICLMESKNFLGEICFLIAFIIGLVIAFVIALGGVVSLFTRAIKQIDGSKHFCIRYFYDIFHVVIFVALTLYVIINWNSCISMQFFSRFDGNNILFLVWIVLILLIIYEVEGKGIRLRKHKQEEDKEAIDKANYLFAIESMSKELNIKPDETLVKDYKEGTTNESRN